MAELMVTAPKEYNGVDLAKLSDKKKAFCEEYTRDYNAARSARAVGYAERYAYQLLNFPEVNAYISWLQDSIRTTQIADRTEILARLTMIMRGDYVEDVVTVDGRVIQKGAFLKDMLKAKELLMKHYGMLKDVQDVNQTVTINVEWEEDVEEDFDDDEEEVTDPNEESK